MAEWELFFEPAGLNESLEKATKARIAKAGGDFREILGKVKDGSLGLVITDPPWNYAPTKSADNWRSTTLLSYEVLDVHDYLVLFELLYRKLKQDRNCWVWSDWNNVFDFIRCAKKAGFKPFAICVAKRRRLGLGCNVRKNCYFVIGLSKGKTQVRGHLEEFLGEYNFLGSKKPWEVTLLLLRHSLVPGEKWLDPFPATHTELPGKLRAGQAAASKVLYKTTFTRVTGKKRTRPDSI